LVGFDGDGDGLLSDSSHQLADVVMNDILMSIDVVDDFISLVLADQRGLSKVGVIRFQHVTLSLDVIESLVHNTTIATLVSVEPRAVHDLLFREAQKSSVGDEVETFEGTSGGERPA